jgi:hypothetical protein
MRARYARAADCQLKQAYAVFFLSTEGFILRNCRWPLHKHVAWILFI